MSKLLQLYKDERRISFIEWHILYESFKGETTLHECGCGRGSCRSIMCLKCWEEAKNELLGKQS